MELWLSEHFDVLFPVFLLLCFGFLLLRQAIHNRLPEYIAIATVESHRADPARYHGRWSSGWNHLVTFRLNDGDTITLYVSQQDFLNLKDGQSVTIVWQDENLLRYE